VALQASWVAQVARPEPGVLSSALAERAVLPLELAARLRLPAASERTEMQ
jgi:hypothetical protein